MILQSKAVLYLQRLPSFSDTNIVSTLNGVTQQSSNFHFIGEHYNRLDALKHYETTVYNVQ